MAWVTFWFGAVGDDSGGVMGGDEAFHCFCEKPQCGHLVFPLPLRGPFQAHNEGVRQMMRSFSDPSGRDLMPMLTDGRGRLRAEAHANRNLALSEDHRVGLRVLGLQDGARKPEKLS